MREAMRASTRRRREDLLLKIGIHEGPCLAVTLNDRQDYFGQTVNIASRVQGLAVSRSILATGSIVDHPLSAASSGEWRTEAVVAAPRRARPRQRMAVYDAGSTMSPTHGAIGFTITSLCEFVILLDFRALLQILRPRLRRH